MRRRGGFWRRFFLEFFAVIIAFTAFAAVGRAEGTEAAKAAGPLPLLAVTPTESRLPKREEKELEIGDEEASLIAIKDYLMMALIDDGRFEVTDFIEGIDTSVREAYIVRPYLIGLNGYTSGMHFFDDKGEERAGGDSGTVEVDIMVKILNPKTCKELLMVHGEGKASARNIKVTYQEYTVSGGSRIMLDGKVDQAILKAATDAANQIRQKA